MPIEKHQNIGNAVMESGKESGLIGRDVTRVDHNHNASLSNVNIMPVIKGVEAKPVFLSR